MYTLSNALPNGSIEENFEFLFDPINSEKVKFVRGHLKTLRDYAIGCNHITEMGVHGVNTTWSFLSAKPKKLVCIDKKNVAAPDILKLAQDLAVRGGIEFEFILGDTLVVEIEQTDMLFIDTDHTYNQLSGELYRHAGKVSKYIAFHDTTMFPDMNRALIDFLNSKSDVWKEVYRTTHDCGLTIIERI